MLRRSGVRAVYPLPLSGERDGGGRRLFATDYRKGVLYAITLGWYVRLCTKPALQTRRRASAPQDVESIGRTAERGVARQETPLFTDKTGS